MSKVINDALIEFLTNPEKENKILVLKGKWGVGKTYFWQDFIKNNQAIIANAVTTYSYVSLFGASSSSELRKMIFNNGKPFSKQYSFWYIFAWEFWFSSIWATLFKKDTWNKLFNWGYWRNVLSILFSKKFWSYKLAHKSFSSFNKVGIIKRYLGDHTNTIESNYIKDMLICFDDIERIDSKFPIETLMGYADELAQQKNCKIILIFNEDELEEKQKEAFNKCREKVVDLELTYSPTLDEQLEIAFGDKLLKYPIFKKIINKEEYVNIIIKNIRVLRKINQILDDFIRICPNDLEQLIMDDFIKRTIYLLHCFYEKNGKLPFEIIKNPSLVVEYIPLNTAAIKGVNEAQEEKAKEHERNRFKGGYDQSLCNELMLKAKQLYIDKPSVFTEEIIHKLEHGFWSEENLKSFISSEIERIDVIKKQSEIRNRLDCAWRLYHSSFQNNLDDIVDIFEKELNDPSNYPYWDYGHFISTLDAYYSFRRIEDEALEIDFSCIDDYVAINSEELRKISGEDRHYIYINIDHVDKSIQDYALQKLDKVMTQKSDVPLAEFVQTLKYEGLSSAQKIYIQNLTEDEIKDWLMSVDDSRMRFYVQTLQAWSNYAFNGTGRHNPDSDTPINRALESLAQSSPLNEYRINNLIRSD